MFALGEKTVDQRKHEIVCLHVVHGRTKQRRSFIIEVQILEVTSMGL